MSFLNMIQRGNIKRIKEFYAMGLRPDAIVNKFAEYNINISVNLVNCVINGELDELDRIALPKEAVLQLQSELDELAEGLLPA